MAKQILAAVVVMATAVLAARPAHADDWVRGYYRSSGTYVQPHYRSGADGNFYNNWSTYPNVNPYTGRTGTLRAPSYGIGYPSYRSSYSPSRTTSGSRWSW